MSNNDLYVAGVNIAGLKGKYEKDVDEIWLSNTDAVLVLQVPQFGEDFDTDGQGPIQTAVAEKVAEILNTRADEEARMAQPGGNFCVIQEGGSSTELYLHVSDSADDAEAFRKSCATEGAYRTSGVIEAPVVLKRLNEKDRQEILNWVESLIGATKGLDLAE